MEAVHFGMSSYHLIRRLTGLAALLLSWGTSSAQPIIGTGDLPQGGETYIRANAVPAVFSDIVEDGGVDLTWDFSDLIATGDLENEYFPMSAANITTQFVFSSADHFTAFELPEIGLDNPLPISGATTYLQFGSSAYKVIGLGITTDIFDLPVIYEDDEELLPLPFVYGASLEGSSAFEVDLPDLLHYSTVQTSDIAVDVRKTAGDCSACSITRNRSAFDFATRWTSTSPVPATEWTSNTSGIFRSGPATSSIRPWLISRFVNPDTG